MSELRRVSMTDYSRMDQVLGEPEMIQIGLDTPTAEPWETGIKAVRNYVRLLREAFKYDLRDTQEQSYDDSHQ